MDAKGFKLNAIVIRCAAPTGKRKVPHHFDGWVIYQDFGSADNVFANCQLVQDRFQGRERVLLGRCPF